MATEITPKLRSGFFLDPINATRIKDSINEQIKKINGGLDAQFEYEVKHANGAVSKPSSLEEILAGENDGSRRVIRVEMFASGDVPENGKAGVTFSDISDDANADTIPLSYLVKSDDQDWAFVTASTIDERLEKIKTNRFINFFFWTRSSTVSIGLMAAIMAICVTFLFPNDAGYKSKLSALRATNPGPLDFMYQAELIRIDYQHPSYLPYIFAIPVVLVIVFQVISDTCSKWIPRQTFYWGDNVRRYDRKMSMAKFIASGVVVAGLVGFGVNYLSARIF